MTDERFLEDSYEREISATVERVHDDRIVLDATIFYPDGGGQPNDTGAIECENGSARVVDVQKKDTIYHTIDGPLPAEGEVVRATLDWERRYAHMRYHTAQHLLSAVLLDDFSARTTGNQLHADRARIDVAYDRFGREDLDAIEERVNQYILDDRTVSTETMERDTAEEILNPQRTRLHLLPDSITAVRIVEIDGVDQTACAGTHVASTGEIGQFTITGRETKGSDEERVRFVLDELDEDRE